MRALGASKSNISQVFNAETFIIGCCAGLLGIGVSLLALIPINSIIEKISGLTELEAQLPSDFFYCFDCNQYFDYDYRRPASGKESRKERPCYCTENRISLKCRL